jgi:hypothetical protein
MNVYPNDDPDTAAKKISKDFHFTIPENGIGKDKNKKQPHFVQKYSEIGLIAEAVIVGGIPYFAVARADSKNVTLEESIPITDKIEYKPFEQTAYLSEPYKFKSRQEFESCIEKARNETLDSLYRKEKAIWLKYIDADDFHISICAADTILTYYQDKMGLTHYLFFIGGNNCGKSNNLLVLKYLAYRNFTSTDMTAANIYQFLGSGEEGQGTLCEDEADRIDEDRQKMAIHKNGYIKGFPVARTDTSFGRKQLKFNTFCFKAFAAERFPDPIKAKGFNQRVIELQCSSGDPDKDIAEVTNPAGEEEFQHLLDELNEMRNLLLVCRLLHFNEKIPDIKLDIKGREKQLFKSVLRIFQNTQALNELLPVISNYVVQKREANYSTLHAFQYRIIKDLITSEGKSEFASRYIWDYIKANLQGEESPGKALSYESSEFGTITQKDITQTYEHIFGAKTKKVNGVRMLEFDLTKLERLGKVYDLTIDIKVLKGGGEDSSSEKLGSLGSDWTDVRISKHIATSTNESEKITENRISEREDTSENDLPYPPNVSKATRPTLTNDSNNVSYRCYHNGCNFHTDDEKDYHRHAAQKHRGIPVLYPTKADLEKYGLKPHGKRWEI